MLLKCRYLVFISLYVIVSNVRSQKVIEAPQAPKVNTNWWKNAVIYQIYPRTFKDADKDGIGDLKGIIEKLSYLKTTGISAIWLPPIYQGPKAHAVDFGYEVVDYMKIDKDLEKGKVSGYEDFDKLIKEAHDLGIKIILEFVPNHSSSEHPWFIKSSDPKDPDHTKFKDFYIWKEGIASNPEVTPPNNWLNHLNEKAWTYNAERKEWYLHQFAPEQPDLNYRTIEVKNEITDALNFWLEKGVDGFWMNSVSYLVEDKDLKMEDHVGQHTQNQKETYTVVEEWRKVIEAYNKQNKESDPRILITSADIEVENIKLYCAEGNKKRAHFTQNNLLMTQLDTATTATSIIKHIESWISNVPPECTSNWMLGSHDQKRVATKYNPERADGMNILTAFLPGIMISYNGEEIGQEEGEVTLARCQDPVACKAKTEQEYQKITKDLGRTPFHWTSGTNAGFSTAAARNLWLPVSTKYKDNNLENQSKPAVTSHYHLYQELIKLRQTPGFTDAVGTYQALKENVIALSKTDSKENIYIAVINIGAKKETIDLSGFPKLNKHVKILVANSASKKHSRVLTTNNIILEPYESIIATTIPDVEEGDMDWWKHAVFYQIYPASFKDSDNNGFGDLLGIISQLEHLKDAGITAAWLSPIFESPWVDQGYDISDFKKIDERFGNITIFRELVTKAHEMGIKIILDFVPNHTSNKHEWFINSEAKVPGFEDFYIWRSKIGGPPTNWLSHFSGSAWTKTGGILSTRYYLHQFAKEQPDLNYRNAEVKQHMKDVLRFWLDESVDGFRIDAVPYLFESEKFENENPSGIDVPKDQYQYLKHDKTSDLQETFDLIYEWRDFIDDYNKEHGKDARVIMTEAYTDIKNTMKYYGDDDRDGAHFTFNFQLITQLNRNSNGIDVILAIKEWLAYMPLNRVPNWVLGNHDNHRVASRFGSRNVDGFNMLIGLLPGVMVTYNGEEIGQENGEPTWKDCQDPRACKGHPRDYERVSRDFERTPFHWNSSTNAGFNEDTSPWLPVSRKYPKVNLALQSRPDIPSHYHVYQQLMQLRKETAIVDGSLKIEALSDNVILCARELRDGDTYVLIFNMGGVIETVNVNEVLNNVTPYLKIIIASSTSYRKNDELIPSEDLLIKANEALIAKYTEDIVIITTEDPGEGGDGEGGGYASKLTTSYVLLMFSLIYFLIV